jgi:hypothetical protein
LVGGDIAWVTGFKRDAVDSRTALEQFMDQGVGQRYAAIILQRRSDAQVG